MTFKEYNAPEVKNHTYDGIRVSTSGISKTISIDTLMRKWRKVRVYFDKENETIKLENCDFTSPLGFKVLWGSPINIKIYRDMPQGRYILIGQKRDCLIFKREK